MLALWVRRWYLEVAVEDVEVVQLLESDDRLDQHAPDLAFLEVFLLLFALNDLLVEVSVVGELHDDAGWVRLYHRFLPSRKASL